MSLSMLQTCLDGGQWINASNSSRHRVEEGITATSNSTGYCENGGCNKQMRSGTDGAQGILFTHPASECARLLPTASTNPHTLANAVASMRRVKLIFLGDSVMGQIVQPLRWAALQVSSQSKVELVFCGFHIIPRQRVGIKNELRRCIGDLNDGTKRVLLLNPALWYQPHVWCSNSSFPRHPSECSNSCRSALRNETYPSETRGHGCFTSNSGTQGYALLRRFQGDNSIKDYAHDVSMLADVLREMQQHKFLVVWLAATPQHFPPDGPFDVDVPPTKRYPCLGIIESRPQLRNDVSLPILRARGINVVNLWEALRGRGAEHGNRDCTHYRQRGASDIPYFMAHVLIASVKVLMN